MHERAIHGALDYQELAAVGLQPDEILDCSVNSHPYGPSPQVREALLNVPLDRYPDRECWQLRQDILQCELSRYQLDLSAIVCGNGSNELIWAIARAYLHQDDHVLVLGPTFGEYRVACQAIGALVSELRSPVTSQLDPFRMAQEIEKAVPRMVWLCNPTNPTGYWLELEEVQALLRACRRIGAWLILDEAYLHFVQPEVQSVGMELLQREGYERLLVLRSLTKDYALAGVRLGYAVGLPATMQQLQGQLPAWNVSGVAQAAGSAALRDQAYQQKVLTQLKHEREQFFQALSAARLNRIFSRTHFCLLDVGNAQQVRAQLLQRRLLVRDCSSFGLPRYIRVATRRHDEWPRLVAALQEAL